MTAITLDKEVVETIDVLIDRELMLAIKEAEEEVKRGKTRPLREFVRELGLEVFLINRWRRHRFKEVELIY